MARTIKPKPSNESIRPLLHRQHRHREFVRFLERIGSEVPTDLEIHLVMDNFATHKAPKVDARFKRHPRYHLHFSPTGASWLQSGGRLVCQNNRTTPPA